MATAFARRSRLALPREALVLPAPTDPTTAGLSRGFQYQVTQDLPSQQQAPVDQYDPLGQGQTRAPGLFARVGGWLRTRDWERIGASMRDDPSILQNLMEERREAASEARQAAEAEAERRTEKQRNEQLESVINALPESEREQARLLARVAPSEFARRYMRVDRGEFEGNSDYTHATRVDPVTGEVTLGDPLPLRPRSGSTQNSAPPLPEGYNWRGG